LHTDVVQRGEALAPEELDAGEVQDELLGDADVTGDETTERLTVGGVDIAVNADEHAPVGKFFSPEDRSAGPFHVVDGGPMCVVQLKWAGSGQRQLLPSARDVARVQLEVLQPEDRIGRRN
jgi:hypothetical protein